MSLSNCKIESNQKIMHSELNFVSEPLDNCPEMTTTMKDFGRQKTMSNADECKAEWDDYVPFSLFVNLEYLKKCQNAKIKSFQDAVYFGEIVNNNREGMGIMKYYNNRVYEGQWKNDLREGKGYEKFENGSIYEGNYKEGKIDGKGVFSWITGEVYDGEWKSGLKQGNGAWRGIKNDTFIGEWKNSKPDGYGIYTWKNGDKYEGELKNGLKDGQGTDIFANGDIYVGEYKNGKPNGQGEYTWANGTVYVGTLKSGLKNGMGKLTNNKNRYTNQYEGQFIDDLKHGFGIFKWASDNVYLGFFKEDERNGFGEMRWTDGSKYIGQWKNGIQNGFGKMIFADGSIKFGYFENNIFKGNPVNGKLIPQEFNKSNFKIEDFAPEWALNSIKNIKSNSYKKIIPIKEEKFHEFNKQISYVNKIRMEYKIKKYPPKNLQKNLSQGPNPFRMYLQKSNNKTSQSFCIKKKMKKIVTKLATNKNNKEVIKSSGNYININRDIILNYT